MKELSIFDMGGDKCDAIALSVDLSQEKIDCGTYSLAVRVLRQNWRQGTLGSKSRGQVAFSNKKPWKQKGTGRARAGSARSPLWRKGGVAFGPQARVKKISITMGIKKRVFSDLLFSIVDRKALHCIDFLVEDERGQTKKAFEKLKINDLSSEKLVLFLSFHDHPMQLAFRNIPNVHVVLYDQPNAFDLSSGVRWVFLKKDSELFKDMVEKWK